MKIKSGFKDYYDSIQKLMYDDSITFIRNTVTIIPNKKELLVFDKVLEYFNHAEWSQHGHRYWYPHRYYNPVVIFICGKVYDMITIRGVQYILQLHDDLEHLKNLYVEHREFDLKNLIYRNKQNYNSEYIDAIHRMYNSPTIAFDVSNCKVIVNPRLNDFNMYRVLDSYTIYQEISMYLSNANIARLDNTELSDESKIAKHGFDKFSFKTRKKK